MLSPTPERPSNLDPLAEALLSGLQDCPACHHLVLGGYFALKHYCDYRVTHDLDAWWSEESLAADRETVRAALRGVLESLASQHKLTVNCRRFGDTESWELLREGQKVFSFQIAQRTLQLEPYVTSPWPPIRIEIELRRPLDTFSDASQRERAARTRTWFRTVFLSSPAP